MREEALNFIELRNAFFVFRFCVKTKMKARLVRQTLRQEKIKN